MYVASFHITSIREVLSEPLTDATAMHWMLFLVTHYISFEFGTLKDVPEVNGYPPLQPEIAAKMIASLWDDTTNVRSQSEYWLDLWPYSTELLLMRDLPSSDQRAIRILRDRLQSLPFIVDVTTVGENLWEPLIDEEDPPIVINVQDDSVDLQAVNVALRFRVGTIELFGSDEDPYLSLPAAEIGLYMVEALRVAKRRGRSALDLMRYGYGYYLVFIYADEDVLICIPGVFRPLKIRARFDTLVTAWNEFAMLAYNLVLRQHYEVTTVDEWWSLLSDHPDEELAEGIEDMATRPFYFRNLRLCFPDT